MKANINCNNLG